MQEMENNSLMTKKQVAQYLQLTTRTVDRLMQCGLPYYKLGNQRCRFRFSDIAQWLEDEHRVVRLR
jgi:excisionase family DNA binding protein